MIGGKRKVDRDADTPRGASTARESAGGAWLSGFVGAVIEAWDEVRVHRTRVLLSLVGVAVAVSALASVVGLGSIAQQAQIESLERGSGRPATLMVGVPFDATGGEQADLTVFDTAVRTAIERYSIEWAGATTYSQQFVQFINGVEAVDATAVDVEYGVMHRIEVKQGRWFTDQDELRLAPGIIINDVMWARLGFPDLATHPTVPLLGERTVTAVIVGVTPVVPFEETPRMYVLNSALQAISSPTALAASYPQWEFWVPPELAPELTQLIQRDIASAFGEGWQVDVARQDYLGWEGASDPLEPVRLVLAGISVLILLLGALGLVNISLVTVRQRIREIGIRRSFGASGRRVFFAVMMESVVATTVSGLAGVMLAILIVQTPAVRDLVAPGLSDVPPFPIEAAVIGLGSATAVGALAGLLPALVAVRVRVIDAIRY